MRTAILIHGYNDETEYRDTSRPAPSNDHWFPWLQRQLLLEGIETQVPEMPGFYEPHYYQWKEMLERFSLDQETILVGHSLGGGFLIRWLSETKQNVGKVVLVAPWLDPKKRIDLEFFNFEIDPNIATKTAELVVMYSTDDGPEILTTIETLKSKLVGVDFQEFSGKGHFCLNDLKTQEFPELLRNLL